jgi:NADPH-dependent 7-cyano-7-deazaguanine reductase QueF
MDSQRELGEEKAQAKPGESEHPAVDDSGLEPLPAPRKGEVITVQTEEVSGLCPVEYNQGNDVRDYYRVTVMFTPNPENPLSVELKSLKLYWEEFQDIPISHEQVASTVYGHLEELIDPEALYVRCEPNIRGGTTTMIEIGEMPEGVEEVREHKDS